MVRSDGFSSRSGSRGPAIILKNGNADNRYAIYGFTVSSQDLHMLDAMVFAVRRLVCELDGRIFPGDAPQLPTVSHREVLTRQSDYYWPLAMPLDVLIRSLDETPLRRAALNLNLAFAPGDYPHESASERSASRSPVIIRRILDPLASDNALCAAEGVEIARWFLANVKLPEGKQNDPGVVEQIREAMEAARARHGLA